MRTKKARARAIGNAYIATGGLLLAGMAKSGLVEALCSTPLDSLLALE